MFILGSGDLVACAVQKPGVYLLGVGDVWWKDWICGDDSRCLHYFRD